LTQGTQGTQGISFFRVLRVAILVSGFLMLAIKPTVRMKEASTGYQKVPAYGNNCLIFLLPPYFLAYLPARAAATVFAWFAAFAALALTFLGPDLF